MVALHVALPGDPRTATPGVALGGVAVSGALLATAAVIALLLALNALYVAAEFAVVSSRRARIRELADDGNRLARQLLPVLETPARLDRYIAACQVGITLSSLVVGFYGQAQLAPLLGPWLSFGVAATVVLVLLTCLQVIFGELLPKSVAMRYPEKLALATALPMVWSLLLMRPLIAVLNGSALALLRLLGLHRTEGLHAHSSQELERIFRDSARSGYLDAEEREMLENTLAIESRLSRQIMIPRTRMVVADVNRPARELLMELSRTPHTRFPVIDGSIDRVVGMLHLRDLFRLARERPDAGIGEIVREPLLAPESNTLSEVWDEMQARRLQQAVLFDEYGGTVGLVTLEDILEEVVGEVQDEFDEEARQLREDDEGRLHVRGDVMVSTVNRKLLLELPEERADTIGGLLLELLGREPHVGDEASWEGVTLRAEEVSDNAVRLVILTLPAGHETLADELAGEPSAEEAVAAAPGEPGDGGTQEGGAGNRETGERETGDRETGDRETGGGETKSGGSAASSVDRAVSRAASSTGPGGDVPAASDEKADEKTDEKTEGAAGEVAGGGDRRKGAGST